MTEVLCVCWKEMNFSIFDVQKHTAKFQVKYISTSSCAAGMNAVLEGVHPPPQPAGRRHRRRQCLKCLTTRQHAAGQCAWALCMLSSPNASGIRLSSLCRCAARGQPLVQMFGDAEPTVPLPLSPACMQEVGVQ